LLPSPPAPVAAATARAIIILAVASIASPCVSVSLILEWSRGTRASSSDRYTLRRPYTNAGLANHDTDARDRRMTTSFHYHPPGFHAIRDSLLQFYDLFFFFMTSTSEPWLAAQRSMDKNESVDRINSRCSTTSDGGSTIARVALSMPTFFAVDIFGR